MQRFTELKVWERSHILAIRIYALTRTFPEGECFGLTSQLRRAATSVPCNIAEGSKRLLPKDYSRFLNVAQGSASETEELLLLGRDLGLMSVEAAAPVLEEVDQVCRMLEALRQRVDREGHRPVALPRRHQEPRSTTGAAAAEVR
jgi:four helix bundle protein